MYRSLFASVLVLATSDPLAARSASYVETVRRYAAGSYRPAVDELLAFPRGEVRRPARELRQSEDLARFARAGAMLHAEAAFARPRTEGLHLDETRAYLALLESRDGDVAFARDVYLLVGYFFTGQLRVDEASPYLERAVALDEDALEPKLAKGVNAALGGWLARDRARLSAAASSFDELSEEEPVAIEARLRRAEVDLLRGEAGQALERLREILPETRGAMLRAAGFTLLGGAYAERGRYEDALRAYEEALHFDARLENAVVGSSFALRALGRRDEARLRLDAFLEAARDDDPLDAWWRFVLGAADDLEAKLAETRKRVTE